MQPNVLGATRMCAIASKPLTGTRPISIAGLAASCLAEMRRWAERRRERAALSQLDERMLKDIGISRSDAWQEIHKPFWRT